MSLCQPENGTTSCGACCGIFNLKVSKAEVQKILYERTEAFLGTVDYSKNWTFAKYRKIREEIESKIEKQDITTYNCPYLGFLDENKSKIGCLIHPANTEDPTSQNFSFYGASICQNYNCKIKQSKSAFVWEKFLSSLDLSYYEYSNLASDHITLLMIEDISDFHHISLDELLLKYRKLIIECLMWKFMGINESLLYMTSFEIGYEPEQVNPCLNLIERLNLGTSTKRK